MIYEKVHWHTTITLRVGTIEVCHSPHPRGGNTQGARNNKERMQKTPPSVVKRETERESESERAHSHMEYCEC